MSDVEPMVPQPDPDASSQPAGQTPAQVSPGPDQPNLQPGHTAGAATRAGAHARAALDDPRSRSLLRGLIALGIGGLIAVAIDRSGGLAGASATLQDMGFDPDRARLIASLTAAALSATCAALVTGSRAMPIVVALATLAGLFGRTFIHETRSALAAHGSNGQFDAVGWALTTLALIAIGLAIGWAATMLSLIGRAWLISSGGTIRAAIGDRRPRRSLWRPAATLVGLIVILTVSPVLADMFNFSPDARMRQGAPEQIGLFGGGANNPAAPAPGSSPIPAPVTGLVPGPEPGTAVSPGSISSDHPWLAWRPSGPGTVETIKLPAPWTGGTSKTAELQIYLPPGYGQGTRSYPVIYEVPWSVSYWAGAIQFPPLLDGLIDSGRIPPEIIVFISAHGGPYPDSECINSFDGREPFEAYITDTVVPWVDGNLRTIRTPAARSLFGFSLGAFCTPNLLFKHPDLFQQAIAMSGYYVAALRTSQTLNAWRPFGGNATLIAANSPMTTAALLPENVRHHLFVALSGDPNEPFYGPQMRQFGTVLEHAGIPYAWLPTNLGHAWAAVREELPAALEAIAQHQVQLHVFQ